MDLMPDLEVAGINSSFDTAATAGAAPAVEEAVQVQVVEPADQQQESVLAAAERVLGLLAGLPEGSCPPGAFGSAHLSVAGACFELGDVARAEASYRRASELIAPGEAEYFEAILGLGLCLDQMGRLDESRRLYEELIRDTRAAESYRRIARRNMLYAEAVATFARAEFDAARALFVKALTLHPGDDDFRSDILLWVGACHARLGQYAAAREAYAELLTLPEAQESVKGQARQWCVFAEGQLHFAARRFQEARAKFEEILANRGVANEFRSGVTLMVAHCCAQLREYSRASRNYRYILKTRNATVAQKSEARRARRALPGFAERWVRGFVSRLGWNF